MDLIMLDNIATHALKRANDTCQDLAILLTSMWASENK